MSFKKYDFNFLGRFTLLFAFMCSAAILFAYQYYAFCLIVTLIVIALAYELHHFVSKSKVELQQFVKAVQYRDFSRHFDEKNAPVSVQPMRKGFNEINSTFKIITRERETQYHYLQKILELVDTGILSYESGEGVVMWMNETLKKMLNLPYLKTIHSLQKRNEPLYHEILQLKPGENKVLTFVIDKNPVKVLLSVTAFQTDDKIFKLLAFQNINEALEESESAAWQKLLSVLTHEIMNSIAPISSLADTLTKRWKESRLQGAMNPTLLEDLELGIETISRRSEGLLKFAETYRNLNKIITPNLKKVFIRDLLENLHNLMQPTLQQKNIEMDIVLKDTDIQLEADTGLVEQVLINLVLNAAEALKGIENANILLSAYQTSDFHTIIKVKDNGAGISQDLMEKIFIPFFSTSKSGSGIGLSLCKQIMMLHKGTITVHSVLGEGTAFVLKFRN